MMFLSLNLEVYDSGTWWYNDFLHRFPLCGFCGQCDGSLIKLNHRFSSSSSSPPSPCRRLYSLDSGRGRSAPLMQHCTLTLSSWWTALKRTRNRCSRTRDVVVCVRCRSTINKRCRGSSEDNWTVTWHLANLLQRTRKKNVWDITVTKSTLIFMQTVFISVQITER